MLPQEHPLETTDLSATAFLDQQHRERVAQVSPKGRFQRFNDEIGYSQFKTIYRAYDAETGRQVSWNTVRAGRISQADRRNILKEIGILKNLSHKNIVGCVDSWVNRQKREIIFITEIFSGGSLSNYLHKIKRHKLKVIKGWCLQIMEGLEHLHKSKPPILHRNIKSDNIFINANTNEIKLGEMGFLATTLDSCKSLYGSLECPVPELAEGHMSSSADIYCLGMVMLEMATLRPPYSECVNQAQIYKRIYSQIRPMTLEEVTVPELRAIITACIGPEKDRPSISQLLAMEFWKANEQVDRLQIQALSQEKQPPSIGEEADPNPVAKQGSQIKNFSKQKPTMEVPVVDAPVVEEEPVTTKINAVMERKDRQNDVTLVFHMQGGKSCELRIIKDKDRKDETERCINYLAKSLTAERQQQQTNHARQQQSFTGVSWHQTKSTHLKFESSLYGSQAKYSEDLPPSTIQQQQPFTTDPIEKIKQQFHLFYQQYRQSLQAHNSFNIQSANEQEMQLRFAIESHELQRIHESDKQQRNLSKRRPFRAMSNGGPTYPNAEHPSSFNLIEMLNQEGPGEADGNSICSKDQSFKNLFSKNEDILSLNYSSIQPYCRDEPLNMDFGDWGTTNFNFLGHDLVSYQPETPIEYVREAEQPKSLLVELVSNQPVIPGQIYPITQTHQSQEESKQNSFQPTSSPSAADTGSPPGADLH